MNKQITQNLLKDRTCNNCDRMEGYRLRHDLPICSLKKRSKYKTCEEWTERGYLSSSMSSKEWVDIMSVKKEIVFPINRAATIRGVRVYITDTRDLIYEQNFPESYVVPTVGGSITLKFT